MRNIFLLLIFLATCSEEDTTCKQTCITVQVNDSLPFQFWVDGQETYNEKQICGVYKACWCAPWLCGKPIELQFIDFVEGQNLELRIYSEEDVLLTTLPFEATDLTTIEPIGVPLQFSNTDFSSDLSGWTSQDGSNRGSQQSFSWSSGDARAQGSPENSKYFATSRPGGSLGWPPGNYVFSVRAKNNSVGDADPIGITIFGMPDGTTQTAISSVSSGSFPNDNTFYTRTISFTTTQYWPLLAYAFTRLGGGGTFDIDFSISNTEITSAPTTEPIYSSTVYDLSFTPSELSPAICNEKVRFEVVGAGVTPRTDCIDIQEYHDCLVEIQYTNFVNFDGIDYESTSPPQTFTALFPAQFWKENNPQTQEDSVLSNGVIVTRRSEIQEKTLLEFGYMPNYMHKKAQKILMHNSVLIEDVNGEMTYWKKRDEYESENLSRYPLKTGSVWLTKYNSVEKNTI